MRRTTLPPVRRGWTFWSIVAVVVWMPAPAAADVAVPTNWISQVTEVEPATPAVAVRVTGGDAFLEVDVRPGHRVQVLGYGDESDRPFLRIERDGTVVGDVRSPSYHRSLDRAGRTPVPDDARADASPRWEILGRGGSHAWHDHRIHVTDPTASPPGSADRRHVADRWEVPLLVDGERVTVRGRLLWVPPAPWWPPAGIAIALAAAVVAARRRAGWTVSATAAVAAGSTAAVIAASSAAAATDVDVPPLADVGLTGLSLAVAVVAIVIRDRYPAEAERMTCLGAAIAAVYGITRAGDALMPFIPSDLPAGVVRYGLASTAGMGIGVLVAYVTTPRGGRRRASTDQSLRPLPGKGTSDVVEGSPQDAAG